MSTRCSLESSFDVVPCDSTQTSSIADQLRAVKDRETRRDYMNCSVLQCMTCNTVLGDSLGICGEVQSLQLIVCLKVSEDVRVGKPIEMSLDGHLAFSTYHVLSCGGCQSSVGLVLHSAPEHLSALRNLFLLRKELINCYMLRNSKYVKASKMCFKHRLMDKNIKERKIFGRMLVTKQFLESIDCHINGLQKLVTSIPPNIFLCVQPNKDIYTDLEQLKAETGFRSPAKAGEDFGGNDGQTMHTQLRKCQEVHTAFLLK